MQTNLQWQKGDQRLPGDKAGMGSRSYMGQEESFGLMDMLIFLIEVIVAQGYIQMSI